MAMQAEVVVNTTVVQWNLSNTDTLGTKIIVLAD